MMGKYVNNNLLKDEKIVYEGKLHWIIFISFDSFLTVLISPLIKYLTSEFVITNKRIIIKIGFLSRSVFEMSLQKIESINVSQTFFERLLGYGNLIVIGTGGSTEIFQQISDPIKFRQQFQEIIN